jgi:hypothetical protein
MARSRAARARLLPLALGAALGAAFVVAFVVAGAATAVAQDGGVVARYPEPAAVASDYKDDAERYAALKILYDDLGAKTTGGRVPGAYAKSSAYFAAFSAVTAKYMDMKQDAPEHVAYSDHTNRLLHDAAFRRTVLEKYRVADIPAPPPAQQPGAANPAWSAGQPGAAQAYPGSGDVTDDMIKAACVRALPFVLAGLAAMWVVSRLLLRNSIGSPSGRADPLPPPAGVPPMPEDLRVVTLPGGVEYAVDTSSGVVIEKETTVATTYHTTTTQGQAYQVGNEIHFTPGQTQTTASTSRTDLIWVRTTEGREESWTFEGGGFKARRGQIISLITRPLPDGTPERMYVYNHATDQFETLAGGSANRTSGRAAWWTSWAIGSVGFGIGFGVLLSIGPDPITFPIGWVAAWVEGAVASVIAAFVVVGFADRAVMRPRVARYESHYVPGFRRYLEQCTPALQKCLGAA